MPIEEALLETAVGPGKRLGKLPPKSSVKQLHFADLRRAAGPEPPKETTFWLRRTPFPARSYGNIEHGDCTIASQAVMATRLERLEQRRTVEFKTDEILRVYYAMTKRLYGGGDTGAFEMDALNNWRNPDLTFRDTKGRPHTIDAYLRVNHADLQEIRRAMAFSGAHGIKVCYALPLVWADVPIEQRWDVPEGQSLTGNWLPNSWGGHSLAAAADYSTIGVKQPHTWYDGGREVNYGIQMVTWRGFAAYCDEAHLVIDSVNKWKTAGLLTKNQAGLLAEMVNSVSDIKIAA